MTDTSQRNKGIEKSTKPVSGGAEYAPFPAQHQGLEFLTTTREEILAFYGVPHEMKGNRNTIEVTNRSNAP